MSSASTVIGARTGALALLADYADLFKLRVTSLVVMTAWTGFYMASVKSIQPSATWTLLHTLLGIGLVSGGAAALNQWMERREDAQMLRTQSRPIPSGRMHPVHGLIAGLVAMIGGSVYLGLTTNLLAATLTFSTGAMYLLAYTNLKKVSPICTFVGAFPGAMPPLLGWVAMRGEIELEAVVLFSILFFWQFPHFLAIAWLYREDYERAGIVMLPVVDTTGKFTVREILVYTALLLPMSLAPSVLLMANRIYLYGALLLGLAFLWTCLRLTRLHVAPSDPHSKRYARQILKASVLYLPALFALMMLNAGAM